MNLSRCIICSADEDLNTSLNLLVDDKDYQIKLCDVHAEEITPKQAKQELEKKLGMVKELMEHGKDLEKCIICSTENNLNTSLSVIIDDEKHTVKLCDEHAEETTPKTAKLALKKKLQIKKEFMEQIGELGMSMTETQSESGIVLVERPEPSLSPVDNLGYTEEDGKYTCICGKSAKSLSGLRNHQNKCKAYELWQENQSLKLSRVQAPAYNAGNVPPSSVPQLKTIETSGGAIQGDALGTNAEGYKSLAVEDSVRKALDSEGKQDIAIPKQVITEVQPIIGEDGITRAVVPKTIQGETGTTKIDVGCGITDSELQRKAKREASQANEMANSTWHSKNAYESNSPVRCSMCRGTGTSRIGGGNCPKCGGLGLFNPD